jgi:hypothetical protein
MTRLKSYMKQTSLFPELEPKEDFIYDKRVLPGAILEKIEKECSEIIKIYHFSGCLFRGVGFGGEQEIGVNTGIYRIIPRMDRMPKDTSKEHHEMIDGLFKKKFGWGARSEGVFAIPDIDIAKTYGKLCLFLPCNGFKYLYSPEYRDLYSDFLETLEDDLEYRMDDGDWVVKKSDKENIKVGEVYSLSELYNKDHSNTSNLSSTSKRVYFEEGKSIVIESENDIDEERLDKMKYVVNTYKDKGIGELIRLKKKTEVMFKCKHYYAITLRNDSDSYSFKIQDIGLGK